MSAEPARPLHRRALSAGWARVQPVLWRLAEVGERRGIDWLLYNPAVMRSFHQLAVADAAAVIESFEQAFPEAVGYVDVGAGSGAFAAEATRRGHPTRACEHSRFGRLMARRQGVDCVPFDLTCEPPARLGGGFDLAFCFEVAEHLPPELGLRLVEFLSRQAPTVVFTAAPPGQGGFGHVNEQPREYWIERFGRFAQEHRAGESQALAGALRDNGVNAPWLIANVMVFRRQPEAGPPSS